jgi:hypothetical protein
LKPNILTNIELQSFPYELGKEGSILKLSYTNAHGSRQGVSVAFVRNMDLLEVAKAFDTLARHLQADAVRGGSYSPERPTL